MKHKTSKGLLFSILALISISAIAGLTINTPNDSIYYICCYVSEKSIIIPIKNGDWTEIVHSLKTDGDRCDISSTNEDEIAEIALDGGSEGGMFQVNDIFLTKYHIEIEPGNGAYAKNVTVNITD